MLVAELMQKPSLLISADDSIHTTIMKLLSLDDSGAAVQKDNKIVGIISEAIILKDIYPTQQEFVENAFHRDFEEMEIKMQEVLKKKVSELMNKNIKNVLVYPSSSVIHVLSLMSQYGLSNLPVVNKNEKIIGVISQRDIFKSLIGSETAHKSAVDYHDWTARFYDLVHTESNRYNAESESLIQLLKKNKIKTVLDIGFGTGSHAIALANAGFNVIGIERSKMPYLVAQKKHKHLPESTKKRLHFVYTEDYINFLMRSPGAYDAVLIMGHILSHYRNDWKHIIHVAAESIAAPGMMIIQNTNTNRILQRRDGLIHSTIADSRIIDNREFSFTLFYDRPWSDTKHVLLTMSVLRYDGNRWTKEAINSVKLLDFKERDIVGAMKKGQFDSMKTYGSCFAQEMFNAKFDMHKHDWFTVVGKKK